MAAVSAKYVYDKVDELEGTDKVGTGQCVALVRVYAGAPATGVWKQGDTVKGAFGVPKGAAIATFVNGKYPNLSHGNHAALFIKQDAHGITVMDQWTSKKAVGSRVLRFKGKSKNGKFIDPSNNGDAFSIID